VKRPWLEPFDWELVTAINAALCQAKRAIHKPTSDGHDPARKLWEKEYKNDLWLDEVVDLCRRCHRLAPFCNFNGNTFAAIARQLTEGLKLPADQAHIVRSWAGHIVAGTASEMEIKQFRGFARSLTAEKLRR
jgi:hypothetical protein